MNNLLQPLSQEEIIRTFKALEDCNGSIKDAAVQLGITPNAMSKRKLKYEKMNPVYRLHPQGVSPVDKPLKILVIPDAQVKPGVDIEHLVAAGEFAADKKPDVIVCIGDFADMPSLSSYDRWKMSYEGRTYKADVKAAVVAMKSFLAPIREEQRRCPEWNPRLVMTLGNHEDRIDRAIQMDRMLEGTISIDDLQYRQFGWEVHPFLEAVEIGGILFCHYIVTGQAGRAASTPNAILNRQHQSCIVGHQQGRQVTYAKPRANGSQITVIIAGSFYSHNEDYLGPQGNNHWRGIIMLHEVQNGSFDEMFSSLNFLMDWHRRKHLTGH